MASSGGNLKGRRGKIIVVNGEWNWIRHGQVEVECMQHDASILEG